MSGEAGVVQCPYLAVVVPAYNEAKRIGPTLCSIIDYLDVNSPTWELIVVDDGSADDTCQVVNETISDNPNSRLISYRPNKGKGAAVRAGVLSSTAELVLFIDADLSTPIDELAPALRLLNEGADLVVGSRGLTDSLILKHQPFYRRQGARLFNLMTSIWLQMDRYADTQCGFKLFKGTVARFLFRQQKINGFMFDIETLHLARSYSFKAVELPVRWTNSPDSRFRVVRDTIRMFFDLTRIKFRHPEPAAWLDESPSRL